MKLECNVDYENYRKIWLNALPRAIPWIIVTSALYVLPFALILKDFLVDLFWYFTIGFYFFILFMRFWGNYQYYIQSADKILLSEGSNRRFFIEFTYDSDGFNLMVGNKTEFVLWESIRKTIETDDLFIFKSDKGYFHIPKESFEDIYQIKYLCGILRSKVKTKMKLLDN